MAENLVQYVNLNYFVPDVEEAEKKNSIIKQLQITPGIAIDLFSNEGVIRQGENLLSTNSLGNNKNDGVEQVLDTMIRKIAPAEAEMIANLLMLDPADTEKLKSNYISAVTSDDTSAFKNTTVKLNGIQIDKQDNISLPRLVQYAFYGDIAKSRYENKETAADIFLDIVRAKDIETIFRVNGHTRVFSPQKMSSSVRGYKFSRQDGAKDEIQLFSRDLSRGVLDNLTKKGEISNALDYELEHNQEIPPMIETLEGIDYTIEVQKKTAKAYNIIITFLNLDNLVLWEYTPVSKMMAEEKGLPSNTPLQVKAKTSDISSFFISSTDISVAQLLNNINFTDKEITEAVLEQYNISYITELSNEDAVGKQISTCLGKISLLKNILTYLKDIFSDIEDFDKDLKEVSGEIKASLDSKLQTYKNFNARGGSLTVTIPLPSKLINTKYLEVASSAEKSEIGLNEEGQEAVSVYWGCIEALFKTSKCSELCAKKNVPQFEVFDYVKKIGIKFLELNRSQPGRVEGLLTGARASKQDAIGYFTEEMFAILLQLISQERGIPLEIIKARAAGKERAEGYQGQADIETEWGGIQAKAYPGDTFTFTFYKSDKATNLTNYKEVAKFLGQERAITLAGFIRNVNTWNEMAKIGVDGGPDPFVDFTVDTIKKIMDLWIPSFMRFADAKYIGENLDKIIDKEGTKLRSKSVLFFSINYNIVPMSMVMLMCKQNANDNERFLIGPGEMFVKNKEEEETDSSVSSTLPDARILNIGKGMANLQMAQTLPFYYKFNGFKVRLKDILGDGNILFA